MSLLRRSLGTAALLIIGFSIVPVSLSPTGGLEVNGLCASGDCERRSGSYCYDPDTGEMMLNYRTVIG